MPKKSSLVGLALALSFTAISLWLSGCSSNDTGQPLAPSTAILSQAGETADGAQVKANLAAKIMTVDQNTRRLTFFGRPEVVEALNNAEIVQLRAGVETQSQFGELVAGDSAHIYAYKNGSTYSYAYRICIVGPEEGCEVDIAFRGFIESIDYANSAFTVEGRPELILIDETTDIWMNVPHVKGTALSGDDPELDRERYRQKEDQHVSIDLTDLQIGDEVEVRADFLTVDSLLALKVKLANDCEERCMSFESTILSIDYGSRTLTFSDQQLTGIVCPNALLLDNDDNPLLIEDFAVGGVVAVKGYPLENGTLRICRLTLLAN